MKNLIILFLIFLISCAHAHNPTSQSSDSWMNLSASERKQMSEMHQKMAECLNSNKSMMECRDYMRSQYPNMKDGNWGMMGHGHMMDHDNMMGHNDHGGCMNYWW
ncbi:MAG: hypothetical protein ACXVLQ_16710 [Bacteriovorax sp.]